MPKPIKLLLLIFLCLGVGVVGSLTVRNSISTWYLDLQKPIFNPPNSIFAPVWTILYILMGTSLYLVLDKGFKTKKVRAAVFTFGIQLLLNGLWSPVFFGLKNLLLALIIISALWYFVLKTIIQFSKINSIASYLLYPYIIWISFAALLNFSIWTLNR